jgi:tRNA pseudouridine38-40 synthase
LRNILLKICFNGTKYCGWQIQKNGTSIQGVLKETIFKITAEQVNIIGCGRTDAGVSAKEYFCNFIIENKIECAKFLTALNALLPKDISVLECRVVDFDFHARYHVKKKEYIYQIYNSDVRNPFYEEFYLYYPFHLDEKMLNIAAQCFAGKKDFRGFMSSGSKIKDTVRTVFEAKVERNEKVVTFTVSADGFLYNMVRIFVGTLLFIAQGKIKAENLKELIEKKDRKLLGATAPPNGLLLNRVEY